MPRLVLVGICGQVRSPVQVHLAVVRVVGTQRGCSWGPCPRHPILPSPAYLASHRAVHRGDYVRGALPSPPHPVLSCDPLLTTLCTEGSTGCSHGVGTPSPSSAEHSASHLFPRTNPTSLCLKPAPALSSPVEYFWGSLSLHPSFLSGLHPPPWRPLSQPPATALPSLAGRAFTEPSVVPFLLFHRTFH